MTLVLDLRSLRLQHELTQAELAAELGLTRQSIIQFEHGRFLPSLAVAYRIAEVFDLSVDELVGKPSRVQYREDEEELTVEVALPVRTKRELIAVTITDTKLVVKVPKF